MVAAPWEKITNTKRLQNKHVYIIPSHVENVRYPQKGSPGVMNLKNSHPTEKSSSTINAGVEKMYLIENAKSQENAQTSMQKVKKTYETK